MVFSSPQPSGRPPAGLDTPAVKAQGTTRPGRDIAVMTRVHRPTLRHEHEPTLRPGQLHHLQLDPETGGHRGRRLAGVALEAAERIVRVGRVEVDVAEPDVGPEVLIGIFL